MPKPGGGLEEGESHSNQEMGGRLLGIVEMEVRLLRKM